MCGIVALLHTAGGAVDPRVLAAATDAIRHRGPDDEGYVLTGPARAPRSFGGPDSQVPLPALREASGTSGESVGLGNRRLAVLDPTPAGHGPMASADGSVWLTYNGEIYNYRELATELEGHGHSFKSGTDTEVVLAAYDAWGTECFRRFNGMWGLALWDARRNRLVVSRDRLGIKPLYVCRIGELVAVASEPKALLAIGASRAIDWDVAYGFLAAGYADWENRTFLREIERVEPATYREFAPDGTGVSTRYWTLGDGHFEGDSDAAVTRFRDLFFDSVRLQLRSDVPVGTCLSGGLDSSSIAAAVAHERAEGQAQHAFCCAFPGTAIDESGYAELVATRVGVIRHETAPRPEEFVADLDALIVAQDEPFPTSSSYAQWRVMRLAAEAGVTVLLDGQGADEILAGYVGFVPYLAAQRLRQARPVRAAHELWAARRNAPVRTLLPRAIAASAPRRVHTALRERSRHRTASHVVPALHEQSAGVLEQLEHVDGTLESALRRSLLKTTLPILLRSEDRNSMAFSRESRVPFLDHRLVELAATLDARLKLHKGWTKVVLREAMRDLLPAEIVQRRDKIGFATPERSWLLGEARPAVEAILDELPADGVLDRARTREMWEGSQHGVTADLLPVWRVVCFERWRALTHAA